MAFLNLSCLICKVMRPNEASTNKQKYEYLQTNTDLNRARTFWAVSLITETLVQSSQHQNYQSFYLKSFIYNSIVHDRDLFRASDVFKDFSYVFKALNTASLTLTLGSGTASKSTSSTVYSTFIIL